MTRLTVIGSINLDLVATAPRLPAAGETVTGATLARHPGGKGANQALAAARLGAEVALIGRVGDDAMADEALALLRAGGVNLTGVAVEPSAPTGVALIAVDPSGENQIVVAAGANHLVTPEQLPQRIEGALIVQLELPIETVEAAVGRATGFVCANLAPAQPVSEALLRRASIAVDGGAGCGCGVVGGGATDGPAAEEAPRIIPWRLVVSIAAGALVLVVLAITLPPIRWLLLGTLELLLMGVVPYTLLIGFGLYGWLRLPTFIGWVTTQLLTHKVS